MDPPDLFITFTCNTKWQEIADALAVIPGQRPDARPDIVSRVFKLKVDELVSELKKGTYFGKAQAGMDAKFLSMLNFVPWKTYYKVFSYCLFLRKRKCSRAGC